MISLLSCESMSRTIISHMSLSLPLRMITSVLFTTNECSAFKAQTFHMHASAQLVRGGTHDKPAQSRHNNIHTQSTYTCLRRRNLHNFLPLTLNKPLSLGLSTLNCFDIGYIGPHNPLTAPNLFTNTPVVDEAFQKDIVEQPVFKILPLC